MAVVRNGGVLQVREPVAVDADTRYPQLSRAPGSRALERDPGQQGRRETIGAPGAPYPLLFSQNISVHDCYGFWMEVISLAHGV